MATIQEAEQCPHCKNQMVMQSEEKTPGVKNSFTRVVHCMTEGCRWFGTGRSIQIIDGEVYEQPRGPRGHDKKFPNMTPGQLAMGQRQVEDVQGKDLRD